MKNLNRLFYGAVCLCLSACGGAIIVPQPNIDIAQTPLTPAPAGDANATAAPGDLTQVPVQAPQFQATIDGAVFSPTAAFYALGNDPQGNAALLLLVTDQTNLCEQVTAQRQWAPQSMTLGVYLYNRVADTKTYATPQGGLSYAAFNSGTPTQDASIDPTISMPQDAGAYASGSFASFDASCNKTNKHLVVEGTVAITAIDTSASKTAGRMKLLLDSGVSLGSDQASFVATACPALLQVPAMLTTCKL